MIDSSQKQPDNRIHLFDPVGLISDSHTTYDIRPAARRATRSQDGSPLRFAVKAESTDGGDSDATSPRLWKAVAPDSRTQAIARGRRELMEMIKDMPESSYELSLRDIVEQKSPSPAPPPESSRSEKVRIDKKMVSRSDSKRRVFRSRSIDNGGFLLKTSVFPISFWLKKNKKKNLESKRKSGVSSESESGGVSTSKGGSGSSSASSSSSSRSSSSGSRHAQSNRFHPGCFSFKAKK